MSSTATPSSTSSGPDDETRKEIVILSLIIFAGVIIVVFVILALWAYTKRAFREKPPKISPRALSALSQRALPPTVVDYVNNNPAYLGDPGYEPWSLHSSSHSTHNTTHNTTHSASRAAGSEPRYVKPPTNRQDATDQPFIIPVPASDVNTFRREVSLVSSNDSNEQYERMRVEPTKCKIQPVTLQSRPFPGLVENPDGSVLIHVDNLPH